MLGSKSQRLAEFRTPCFHGLLGPRIDEIQRNTFEGIHRQTQCALGFGNIMQTAQHFQIRIVERLHAQRQPVDTRVSVVAKARTIGAGGIGFERDLDIVCSGPKLRDPVENMANRLAAHQGRRAAAEKDRFDGGPRGALQMRDIIQLAHDRIEPAAFVDCCSHMGIEIAIGAFGRTERPMDIDAEAAAHAKRFVSLAKARVRWLMPCLVGGAISPKVSFVPSAMKIES